MASAYPSTPTLASVRASRLWSLLLLPGVLVTGRVLGDACAEGLGSARSIDAGHGYLGALGCIGLPLTLAVLARAVVAGMRSEREPVSFAALALPQVLVFATFEVVEHVHAGVGAASTVRELSFLLGLVAQLAVAWMVCAFLRAANRAVRKVVQRRRWVPRVPVVRTSGALVHVERFAVAVSSLSRRGPPRSLQLTQS